MSQIGLDLQKMTGQMGAALQKDVKENLIGRLNPKLRAGVSIGVQPTSAGGFTISVNIEDWIKSEDKKVIEDKIRSYFDMIGARHGACSGPVPKALSTIIG